MKPTEEELNNAAEVLLTGEGVNVHKRIIDFILSRELSVDSIRLFLKKHPKYIIALLAYKNINDILSKEVLQKLKTTSNPTTISKILYNNNIDTNKKVLLLKNNFAWLREISYYNSGYYSHHYSYNIFKQLYIKEIEKNCSPDVIEGIHELIEPYKKKIESHNFINIKKPIIGYQDYLWQCNKCKMNIKLNIQNLSIYDIIVYLGRKSKILSCDQMIIKNIVE